jgi:hypothetical protein
MTLSRQSGVAFLLSVVIGAIGGVLLILLWDAIPRVNELTGFAAILFWGTLVSASDLAISSLFPGVMVRIGCSGLGLGGRIYHLLLVRSD